MEKDRELMAPAAEQEIVEAETGDEVTAAEGAAEAPAGEVPAEEPLLDLREELESERRSRKEAEDRALRYRADFENYRRRIQSEAEQMRLGLTQEIVRDLLPVLDDLERALASTGAPPGWASGLDIVYRRFLEVLQEHGVTRLETVGREFDPEKHEAMLRVEGSDQPANTVIEELRAGYALGDRVIRPALVKVQI